MSVVSPTMLRAAFAMVMVLGCACAPHESKQETDPGPSFPAVAAYPPPSGSLGNPDDVPVEVSPSGQWLAVCRPTPDDPDERRRATLVLDGVTEVPIDLLEAFDDSGRYLLMTQQGHRYLYDAVDREAEDLGRIQDGTPGSFSQGRMAYGHRGEHGWEVIVVDLRTGTRTITPSPLDELVQVGLDEGGQAAWLRALELATEDDREYVARKREERLDASLCSSPPGCFAFEDVPRVNGGMLWLGGSTPTFVELDEQPIHPRSLQGAAVIDSDRGVELIYADRRETITAPGCRLVRGHHDPQALLYSCNDDGTERYFVWRDGGATPLAFTGPGRGRTDPGSNLVSGAGSRWLRLDDLVVLQGVSEQYEGHAFGDHVLLVGQGAEIRDARTDTRVLHHPLLVELGVVQGPFATLDARSDDDDGGWVIDLRDGRLVQRYEQRPLALSRTGQVLQRGDDGRFRWAR